jgi:hypothetical protein
MKGIAMTNDPRLLIGWATPLIPKFDTAALARRLGHVESKTCLARKQGQCPGKYYCADCPWAEGPLRESD